MYALTIDQDGSRTQPDGVPGLLKALKDVQTVIEFERTVGDEIQGVLNASEPVYQAIEIVLNLGGWHIGLGMGEVAATPGASTREARGSALIAARDAVERSKRQPARAPISVISAAADHSASDLEVLLRLTASLITPRSDAARRAIEATSNHPGATQQELAAKLGITHQSVSRTLFRAHHAEVMAARPLILRLLQAADAEATRR